ncbi:MAG TPA: hypothetical protein VH969_26910 [Actinophytocola sp.]|jgi:hypothetical protein|uniref:hypothetical protein n=1 Tax=Actinophytocola sp. TaxID=1872138 RepID=UPI002F922284
MLSVSAAGTRIVAAALSGVIALGLAACAQPVDGTSTAAPRTSTSTPPPATVTVTPSTVYVPPPATVTVPDKPLTPCQKLHAAGYSYDVAYAAWADAGFPANWDADKDGLPCEQSYGEQN